MTIFDDIALKIVPVGYRPSVTELRREIADAIESAVIEAVQKYRQENWPSDMRELVEKVKANRADADRRLSALEKERKEFKRIVAGHLELLTAIEKWIEWCEGRGETEHQPQLWDAVKKAWNKYRLLKVSA